MGKGTIAGGGADGLYTITLDYGSAAQADRLAAMDARLAVLDTSITAAQAAYDAALAAENAQKALVNDTIAAYVAASNAVAPAMQAVIDAQEDLANGVEGAQDALTAANAAYAAAQAAVTEALQAYTDAATELVRVKADTAKLRVPLDTLKAEQAQLTKDRAKWAGLALTETLSAWCADLTENATGEVATIEVPGENALVLIAPAAPAPTAADGLLTAREVQSPAQAFWNAAVLPGWQKWKPTYRTGIITALNTDADTASVTLDAATSSAQGLPINQATTLADVPVVYMECHASAFEVGDACVVQFTGQDQAAPKVVGFRDHPKACAPDFVLVPVTVQHTTTWEGAGEYQVFNSVGPAAMSDPCGYGGMLFHTGVTTAAERYVWHRIKTDTSVYFPLPAMGWSAPGVDAVELYAQQQGVPFGGSLSQTTPPAAPIAHRTYNKQYNVMCSWAGLLVEHKEYPVADFANIPGGHNLAIEIVPGYEVCKLLDIQSATAHNAISGYPPIAIGPAAWVKEIDTADFAEMAAFLGVSAKMPPTLPVTKGERIINYELDGVTGAGEYGSPLYVRYKRPGAPPAP